MWVVVVLVLFLELIYYFLSFLLCRLDFIILLIEFFTYLLFQSLQI